MRQIQETISQAIIELEQEISPTPAVDGLIGEFDYELSNILANLREDLALRGHSPGEIDSIVERALEDERR